MHGIVRHLLADRTRKELGGVTAQAVVAVRAHVAGHIVDECAGRLGHGIALADIALDLTEAVDRLAEGDPLIRVAHHDLQAAIGDAQAHGSQGQPLDLQVAHHVHQATALLSQQVSHRDATVLEDELAHGAGAHAHLVDGLAGGEARTIPVYAKGGDGSVHFRVDQEYEALGSVRDVGLGAVEHVAVAVAYGRGGHAQHIGAVAWLSHAHAADPLAGQDLVQVVLLLFVIRAMEEVVHEQHRVCKVGQAEPGIALGQFVVDDDCRGRVHACTAPLLGDGDAVHAQLTELAEQRQVQVLGLVELLGLGFDLARGEVRHQLAEHLVLGRGGIGGADGVCQFGRTTDGGGLGGPRHGASRVSRVRTRAVSNPLGSGRWANQRISWPS